MSHQTDRMISTNTVAKEQKSLRYTIGPDMSLLRAIGIGLLGFVLILIIIAALNLVPVPHLQERLSGFGANGARSRASDRNGRAANEKGEAPGAPVSNGSQVAQPAEASGANVAASNQPAAPAMPVAPTDVDWLKGIKLLIPVQGVVAKQLHDSFYDKRSEGRTHQAIDIMSACGTPVLATADGTVTTLHNSPRGGISLYQTDSSGRFVYFYGHLQRYADGVVEGQQIKRGQLIGYVGDTGNAGSGNCHLHFGISKPLVAGKWSGGEALDPYPILAGE